jgi:hypothetical protein
MALGLPDVQIGYWEGVLLLLLPSLLLGSAIAALQQFKQTRRAGIRQFVGCNAACYS